MNKGIQQVRKSIQQRKNKRKIRAVHPTYQVKKSIPLPTMEEKHGFLAHIETSPSKKTFRQSRLAVFMMKGMLSVSLFFIVAIIMESNQPLFITPKTWTSNALTNDFPFARVHAWYTDTFGSPLGFTPKEPVGRDVEIHQLPVSGDVTEPFQSNGTGIYISPHNSEDIQAWESGIVTFVGKKKGLHQTIMIQHVDGSKTTYGNVSSTDVHIYQHVQQHETIGSFDFSEGDAPVFFSLEQDQTFVDPIQVIKVDDQP